LSERRSRVGIASGSAPGALAAAGLPNRVCARGATDLSGRTRRFPRAPGLAPRHGQQLPEPVAAVDQAPAVAVEPGRSRRRISPRRAAIGALGVRRSPALPDTLDESRRSSSSSAATTSRKDRKQRPQSCGAVASTPERAEGTEGGLGDPAQRGGRAANRLHPSAPGARERRGLSCCRSTLPVAVVPRSGCRFSARQRVRLVRLAFTPGMAIGRPISAVIGDRRVALARPAPAGRHDARAGSGSPARSSATASRTRSTSAATAHAGPRPPARARARTRPRPLAATTSSGQRQNGRRGAEIRQRAGTRSWRPFRSGLTASCTRSYRHPAATSYRRVRREYQAATWPRPSTPPIKSAAPTPPSMSAIATSASATTQSATANWAHAPDPDSGKRVTLDERRGGCALRSETATATRGRGRSTTAPRPKRASLRAGSIRGRSSSLAGRPVRHPAAPAPRVHPRSSRERPARRSLGRSQAPSTRGSAGPPRRHSASTSSIGDDGDVYAGRRQPWLRLEPRRRRRRVPAAHPPELRRRDRAPRSSARKRSFMTTGSARAPA
jgi:hypothetical protein